MKSAPKPARKPALSRIPLRLAVLRVTTISLAVAVLALAGLSLQMAAGKDPALAPKLASTGGGSGANSATAPPATVPSAPATVPSAPATVPSTDSSGAALAGGSGFTPAPQAQTAVVTPSPVQTSTS